MLQDLPTDGAYQQVIRGVLPTWKPHFSFFFSLGIAFSGGWRALRAPFQGSPHPVFSGCGAPGITDTHQISYLVQRQLYLVWFQFNPFHLHDWNLPDPSFCDVFSCPNSDLDLTTSGLTGPGHPRSSPCTQGSSLKCATGSPHLPQEGG